jgi:hypothetical protein
VPGTSKATLNGKDVTKRLVRLVIEKPHGQQFLVYQAENRLRKRISSQNALLLLRLKYLLALATFLINRRIFVLL